VNILFLSELFYPHGGGAELATFLYAKLLSSAGFSVVVVTNRFSGEQEFSNSDGFAVYRLPLFEKEENVKYSILKRVDVLLSVFMRKLLRWADVVYVPRFWFSAIPLAKALGKPVITHLHDYIPICPLAIRYDIVRTGVCENRRHCYLNCIFAYERRKRNLTKTISSAFLNTTIWFFLRESIKLSDAIICVSNAQRNILQEFLPSIASRLKVIYNPLPELSQIAIEGDHFGYFGGLSFSKGFHVLFKAMSYRRRPRSESVIVHCTKFHVLSPGLGELFRKAGFLVYGKLGRREYDRVYRMIKAVIVPSVWHEPLPYVVTESALRGRIIIASNIGGIPELVNGCRGVFLFDAGDAVQLAERIRYVSGLSRESG